MVTFSGSDLPGFHQHSQINCPASLCFWLSMLFVRRQSSHWGRQPVWQPVNKWKGAGRAMKRWRDKESFQAVPSGVMQTSNYQMVPLENHVAEAATGAVMKVESLRIPGPWARLMATLWTHHGGWKLWAGAGFTEKEIIGLDLWSNRSFQTAFQFWPRNPWGLCHVEETQNTDNFYVAVSKCY